MKKTLKFYTSTLSGTLGYRSYISEIKHKLLENIPNFESEKQATDWYNGVYLAEQKRVDNINSKLKWWREKEVNELPEKILIFNEYSI
jgi:hypothetical protein